MVTLTKSARENFIACVTMLALATVTVMVRFLLRASQRQMPLISDWVCLLALLLFAGYCAVIINHMFNISMYGAFDNDLTLGQVEFANLLQTAFITEILFTSVITAAKLSILLFYWTIFAVNVPLKRVVQVTVAGCLAWWIGTTLAIIFQCNPIEAYWTMLAQPPYCISTPRLLLGIEVTNLFFDVLILVIPTTVVRQLRLPPHRKLSLAVVFFLGAFVCVASIVRITAIWHPPDLMLDFEFSATMLWSTLQLGMAIICGCLPTLGPLFTGLTKVNSYILSWYGSVRSTAGFSSKSGYKMSNQSSASRPWVDGRGERHHGSTKTWATHANTSKDSQYPLEPMPTKQIRVKRDVEVA